ncbi:ATP synthase subunit delta [Wenxinia marina]|uniref:ATP synthase subunit delta n=1 Tax=Wenxinia marina DSM 24838 TaxID=1123501 RepID=A0A0D0Q6F4_9RHOB|nr:ATP synthase F1 subcomplex delta subunit [Wenxinia marina DSM 24838]GGL75224.1 ATP synthase subunit delta [Wenxinia marina]
MGPARDRQTERVDVSEPASIATGIAQRYATAVFDIARDENGLDRLESDVDALSAALAESDDLRDLIANPVYGRDEQQAAITAIARKMDLSQTVTNVLALMAQKRRLFVLPQMLTALRERIATHKGEVTADVVSARALSDDQKSRLARTLSEKVGSDVKINATVDESLIGGLVVKVGSRMIDTSIASKLAQLQNTMKEAR